MDIVPRFQIHIPDPEHKSQYPLPSHHIHYRLAVKSVNKKYTFGLYFYREMVVNMARTVFSCDGSEYKNLCSASCHNMSKAYILYVHVMCEFIII